MTPKYGTSPIPLDYLKDKYECDFDNGILYRRVSEGRVKVGTHICRHRGYKCKIRQKLFMVHRIIWAMYHGVDPMGYVIDHINGDRYDNRICNLRAVSQSINNLNRKTIGGVRRNHNTWQAYVCVDSQFHCLGNFATVEEAEECRRQYNTKLNELLCETKHAIQTKEYASEVIRSR